MKQKKQIFLTSEGFLALEEELKYLELEKNKIDYVTINSFNIKRRF